MRWREDEERLEEEGRKLLLWNVYDGGVFTNPIKRYKEPLKVLELLAERGRIERFGFPKPLNYIVTPEGRRWVSGLPV